MTLLEAIQVRHAVRKHTDEPIPDAVVKTFQAEIDKAKVVVKPGSAMMGYTVIDSGIAMYNFEVGAGAENFVWA